MRRSFLSLLAFPALLSACVLDTDAGKSTVDEEDTAGDPPEPVTHWTEWVIGSELQSGPIQGQADIGGTASCRARLANDLDGYTVTAVNVHGSSDKVPVKVRLSFTWPDTELTGNVARVTGIGGAANYWTAPDEDSTPSFWYMAAGVTTPMTCTTNSCGTGWWEVDIYPEDVDLGSGGGDPWNCEPYTPITLSLTLLEEGSATEEAAAADCTSGTGVFRLVPVGRKDDNYDTNGRQTYVPMQISGTGTMTNKAQVSQINLVANGGYPLRVLKGGADVAYTAQDFLAQPAAVSVAITGQHSFASGVLTGRPRFVHPPLPESTPIDARVSMTWTCGGTTSAKSVSAGYQIAANTLGCGPIQKLVVRPHANTVDIEPYGDPSYVVRSPLDDNGNFSVDIGNFSASARLLSYNANSASMELVSASVGGLSVCTAGTYTLTPE